MRNDAGGEAERVADLMQVITELTNERFFGAGAGQESSIGRQRVEGTKESEALDEFTYKRIHRGSDRDGSQSNHDARRAPACGGARGR